MTSVLVVRCGFAVITDGLRRLIVLRGKACNRPSFGFDRREGYGRQVVLPVEMKVGETRMSSSELTVRAR